MKKAWYHYIDLNQKTADRTERAIFRTEGVLPYISDILKPNDVVVDIGCNSGFHSFYSSRFCKKVIGIEMEDSFIKHSRELISLNKKGEFLSDLTLNNVEIKKLDILNNLNLLDECTVLFALKVLYHPDFAQGISKFMDYLVNTKVTTILAQGHAVPYYKKYGTADDIIELFSEYGFQSKILNDNQEYPIILGKR